MSSSSVSVPSLAAHHPRRRRIRVLVGRRRSLPRARQGRSLPRARGAGDRRRRCPRVGGSRAPAVDPRPGAGPAAPSARAARPARQRRRAWLRGPCRARQERLGKSTIAAALHAKGYDLVADDVAAIEMDRHGPRVLAGFPQVKLWPEAATLLGDRPETLPLLHPSFDKRGWRAARGFSMEPRRLEQVYVIAPGPTPAIEPLGPREACFELMAHWYGHRFGGGWLDQAGAGRHLAQCTALAGHVSTGRLRRAGGSKSLLDLADLVAEARRRDIERPRGAAPTR